MVEVVVTVTMVIEVVRVADDWGMGIVVWDHPRFVSFFVFVAKQNSKGIQSRDTICNWMIVTPHGNKQATTGTTTN